MPQDSYNQYEQHAAAKRCQQQDEDVFTEVIQTPRVGSPGVSC